MYLMFFLDNFRKFNENNKMSVKVISGMSLMVALMYVSCTCMDFPVWKIKICDVNPQEKCQPNTNRKSFVTESPLV